MFIGHYGVGLAAKGIDRKPSLGTLLMAAQFLDLIWPVFLISGLEKVKIEIGATKLTPLNFGYYPFTHSLGAVVFWGILFGLVYFLFKRNLKSSLLMFFLVVSHWIIDFIVQPHDIPLFPWIKNKLGLGIWNSPIVSISIEVLIFLVGAGIYIHRTHSKNEKGIIGVWSFLIFLLAMYIMNVFGSPPASTGSVVFAGLAQWIFIIWGYWIDKNRTSNKHYTSNFY